MSDVVVVVVPLDAESSPPDVREGDSVLRTFHFHEENIDDQGLADQGQVDPENQLEEVYNNCQQQDFLPDLWLRGNCCLWSKRKLNVTNGKLVYDTKKCWCCWQDKVTIPLRNFITKVDVCDNRNIRCDERCSFQVETPSSTTKWRVIPRDSTASSNVCRMCGSWIKHSLGCCFPDNPHPPNERLAAQWWVERIRVARLGPTPSTEDTKKSALANAEKYAECIQSLISQEASMRNNRMTWFGTIQGFLWLSFAYLFTSVDSCRNGFWIMQVILPIMGLIICLWVFRLINTADRAVKVLAKRWEIYKFNSGDPRTKYYERPVFGLDSQERSRAHCWMVIPFLLIALGWAGCLVATAFLEDCRWTVYSSSNTTSTSSPSSN